MRRLQFFSFKRSRYERPQQAWVCGRTTCGKACIIGPDAKGDCRASFECVPLKKGDRWHCTRPEVTGGACPSGPLPDGTCCNAVPKCIPVRSLRSRRALAVWWTGLATAGLLLLGLVSRRSAEHFSPGPVSFKHSSFANDCHRCHGDSFDGDRALDWLALGKSSALSDAEMGCVHCHPLGADPFGPHGQPLAALREASAAKGHDHASPDRPLRFVLAGLVAGNPVDRPTGVSCAACHQEHQGHDHQLTRLRDDQCQSCHGTQFHSFNRGHPDFHGYPFRERTHLEFDHRSHLDIHFKDPKFADAALHHCSDCHAPDALGEQMGVRPYEQTCAACHDDQVKGRGRAGSPGITFFRIPGMDVEAMEEKKLDIGQWPEDAEGTLTPYMELLLSGDAETASALTRLKGVDLLDLLDASDARAKDAVRVAWAVKQLLHDLSTGGQAALQARLQPLRKTSEPLAIGELAGLLSPDVIQSAINDWFPNLAAEVEAHKAGKPSPAPKKPGPSTARGKTEQWVEHGGWFRSANDFSISYRPAGHADSFLRGWIHFSGEAGAAGLFDSLANPKAPGTCVKCHGVESAPALHVNWRAQGSLPAPRTTTRFKHGPHFSLIGDQGCLTCHTLDTASPADAYAKSFGTNRNAAVFHSNFLPIAKTTCMECHTESRAGESCQICHRYHVGEFTPTLTMDLLPRAATNAPSASK
jgi:hypothetical protein